MHTGAKFLALMTEPFPMELNAFKITKDTNKEAAQSIERVLD